MANEKRLIDANAFLKDILTAGIGKTIIEYSESDIGYMIRKRPTVDAAEVVHGYWYEHYGIAICSHCQSMFDHDLKMLQVPSTWKMPNYCPNCGAKMDVDTELKEGVD